MRKFLVTVLFVLSTGAIFAQQAGLSFSLGFPQAEFKENMKRTGVGANLEALLIKSGPASMGLNLGYYNYGSETRRERFSTTIPDVMVDVSRNNNILQFHLLFHVAPEWQSFIPYAEGLFGGSYIFTETTIQDWGNDDDVASSTNFDDFAWSYGAGGGFQVLLASNPAEEISEIFLDFKVRYIFGGNAQYLKEGSIVIENGYARFTPEKSKTDLLTASLGISVSINPLF